MPVTRHVLRATYAALFTQGPMTLEQLAGWAGRDPYVVNNWLYCLRRRGLVELTERGAHRNRRGMKCGLWRTSPLGGPRCPGCGEDRLIEWDTVLRRWVCAVCSRAWKRQDEKP